MSIAEKLTTIASNQQRVYDAGKEYGYNDGYGTGLADGRNEAENYYERGKQAEYDRFWDIYQDNGNRTNYDNAFGGLGWTNDTFTPKHDICPKGSGVYMMFRNADIQGDLVQILEDCGVALDVSKTSGWLQYSFFTTQFTRLGRLDFSNVVMLYGVFEQSAKLHTIDELVVGASCEYTTAFNGCAALTNITIEGEIGKSINFQCSPLSVASMKSVISALKNYAGTDKDGANTVRFTNECWTALEADSTAPDGGTWQDYVNFTLGWAT